MCVGCTFINKPRRPGCEQCGTARPEDYKIPDNCPLDDDELRILQQQEENEKLFQEVCMLVCGEWIEVWRCGCGMGRELCRSVFGYGVG